MGASQVPVLRHRAPTDGHPANIAEQCVGPVPTREWAWPTSSRKVSSLKFSLPAPENHAARAAVRGDAGSERGSTGELPTGQGCRSRTRSSVATNPSVPSAERWSRGAGARSIEPHPWEPIFSSGTACSRKQHVVQGEVWRRGRGDERRSFFMRTCMAESGFRTLQANADFPSATLPAHSKPLSAPPLTSG